MMEYLFFVLECQCYRCSQHHSTVLMRKNRNRKFYLLFELNHTDARCTIDRFCANSHYGFIIHITISLAFHSLYRTITSRMHTFLSTSHWSLNYQFSVQVIDVENRSLSERVHRSFGIFVDFVLSVHQTTILLVLLFEIISVILEKTWDL